MNKINLCAAVTIAVSLSGCGGSDALTGFGNSNETGCVHIKQQAVGYDFTNTCNYKIRVGVQDNGGTDIFKLGKKQIKHKPYPHRPVVIYAACKSPYKPKFSKRNGSEFKCV
ncbi:MAG: hypothetical protein V3V09_02450 [Arenicellales bacterium]